MIHTMCSVVAGIDPRLALDPVQPMTDAISAVEAPRRFNTGLITALALASSALPALRAAAADPAQALRSE